MGIRQTLSKSLIAKKEIYEFWKSLAKTELGELSTNFVFAKFHYFRIMLTIITETIEKLFAKYSGWITN